MKGFYRKPLYPNGWDVKEDINKIFKAWRAAGYLARQNHLCCSSCAGSDLATKFQDRTAAGKNLKGIVFYHRQDTDHFYDDGRLMIRYGHPDHSDEAQIQAIGEELVRIVRSVAPNIVVEWSGSASACIELHAKGGIQ